jgi:flagellar M-ring protein FliF
MIAILAGVAIIATMFGISRIATAPDLALLYSGLEPQASGEVVTALEGEGVSFEVRGTSIYVERVERDRLRMDLAAQGMPTGGPAGYEILDSLSGFGTTSQMFDAAYWRAKEGELARTIVTSPNIRAARVHIANPVQQPFSRTQTGSASVTVTMASGTLDPEQAEAIRYLVSSAVAGLGAQDVAVIDAVGGVVLSGEMDEMSRAGITRPDEKADQLRTNILRLLEARVGRGRAIVEVNVDASMDSQTISERRIDPDSRVAISSESEQSTEQSSGPVPGVTVASNLPDGDVEGGAGESSRSATETLERQNFEVSETRSERVILPGQVRRITVAVMVDGILTTDAASGEQTWEPRSEAEMATLRQLVETAAGFDPARGDTVTIETLQFTAPPEQGTLVQSGEEGFLNAYGARLIQVGVLGAIILALIFFVLRPMMSRQPASVIADLTGENQGMIEGGARDGTPQIGVEAPSAQDGDILDDLPVNSLNKIDRLREVISNRSDDSARVLRSWIEAPDGQKEPAA